MARKIRGHNEGSVLKRKNGKWRAQISVNGKRLSHEGKTQKECLVWLRENHGQISKRYSNEDSKQATSEFFIAWLASKKTSLRSSTWEQYERLTRTNILPHIGGIKISELTPAHIQHL